MGNQNTQQLSDAVYKTLKKRRGGESPNDIVVLESQLSGHPESISTYIAAFPKKRLVIQGRLSRCYEYGRIKSFENKPWDIFKRFRQESEWLFGFIGYDMKNNIHSITSTNKSMYNAPDLYMMEPSVLFKIENDSIEQILGETIDIGLDSEINVDCIVRDVVPRISKDDYITTVRKIKDYIKEGDFYELNYSYPFTAGFSGDSFALYKKMRAVNPVPFGSFIELDDVSICCFSPERFLKNSGGHLLSEPIKGTSGRSTDPVTDERLRNELKNAKNEAENLMIVDLVRHDLSRVSKPGSIRVSKLYDIQTFDTVHQLISRIEGEMMVNTDPVEVIKACFPMGSMTGAPKLEVMKHIEDLECYKRGIYSGSIGYFTPDGDFDFNVVIRTAIIQGNSLTYPAGGAITGDSDPYEEWNETLIKARNLTSLIPS
ncbi:anthranilate synthase component I family protein [soil metagenome]